MPGHLCDGLVFEKSMVHISFKKVASCIAEWPA